jgi:hypothetical protein
MYAKRVSLSIVEEPLRVAEVVNGSPDNIYMVGVYIRDRLTGEVFANSGSLIDIIPPGQRHRFSLTPTDRSARAPAGYYCFVQFTDGNGYRWSRYMMGLLEEVIRDAGDDERRASAQRVSLSIVEEPFKTVEVINGSSSRIFQVSVLIEEKSSNSVVARSDTSEDTIEPGHGHCFNITATRPSRTNTQGIFCIAQFTDEGGIQWHRFMLGRLDRVGPESSHGHLRITSGAISSLVNALKRS